MLVITLGTLVQRGFSAFLGGKAGNPRLGTSGATRVTTPEIRISLRHPSHSPGQEYQPAMRLRHADDRVDVAAAFGTGRSPRWAGVLSRSYTSGIAWCKPACQTALASSGRIGVR